MSELTGRFEMRGELGAGGMGVVYRVLDRARGVDVALKTLKQLDGRGVYRFKREFRTLAGIEHPNLIALHDLYQVGGDWMFTMDLVDGVTFIDWVRPAGQLDEARLREALYQLTDGLTALHAVGRLHRDIKPSNVLVDGRGRVVLLDFGLAAEFGRGDVERTHEARAIGTPAYMSPEQAADAPLNEASDWYCVGTMLYEALAGRLPFEGPSAKVLQQKQTQVPQPPGALAAGVPVDLEALCLALLASEPQGRAGGTQILAALGREPSAATARIVRGAIRAPLVGRDDELVALRQALSASRDHYVVMLVTGPAGAGKTALMRAFVEKSRINGAVILTSKSIERESIPLAALDQLVDSMSSHLMRYTRDDLAQMVPRDLALLAHMFPALRRVPAMRGPSLPGQIPPDPDEQLGRAGDAIAGLVTGLARERPVIATMDDLQWSEPREIGLIHRYAEAGPPVLNLFGIRTGDGVPDDVLDTCLQFRGDLRRIQLA